MRRILGRLIRALLLVCAIIFAIPVLGLGYGFLFSDPVTIAAGGSGPPPPTALRERVLSEIPGYQRPEESTFLTYPEWAIVYAAREFAVNAEQGRAGDFPYWSYIGRFWQDYAVMIRATRDYPFNLSNHVMLAVIGTSHTVEHAIEWAYEHSFGLATAMVAREPVPEDRLRARTAAQYAAFLDQVPWYRFDYAGARRELWNSPAAPGAGALRSYERRLAFGLAYTIKQAYADLIASGLSATSDPAADEIHVWAKGPVGPAVFGRPDTALELDFGDDGAILVTRRYQAFSELVPQFVERGISFVEIGGNDDIFVTFLSEAPVTGLPGATNILSYPVPARPQLWRTGMVVRVSSLHEVLKAAAGARLEHIYDY